MYYITLKIIIKCYDIILKFNNKIYQEKNKYHKVSTELQIVLPKESKHHSDKFL